MALGRELPAASDELESLRGGLYTEELTVRAYTLQKGNLGQGRAVIFRNSGRTSQRFQDWKSENDILIFRARNKVDS